MNWALNFLLLTINLLLAGLLLMITDGFDSVVNVKLAKVVDLLEEIAINFPQLPGYILSFVFLLFVAFLFIKRLKYWKTKNGYDDGKNHPAIQTVYYDTIQAGENGFLVQNSDTYNSVKKETSARRRENIESNEKKNGEENAWNRSPGELKNPFTQLDILDEV